MFAKKPPEKVTSLSPEQEEEKTKRSGRGGGIFTLRAAEEKKSLF